MGRKNREEDKFKVNNVEKCVSKKDFVVDDYSMRGDLITSVSFSDMYKLSLVISLVA